MVKKTGFALYFGNRGFFPETLIHGARVEMSKTLKALGYGVHMLEAGATRFGAVETPAEGAVYARFLEQNRAKIDGVIVCLPNFGDETGAIAALQDAGVPILIQAYPDELKRMDIALRRDAFCGKISIMDVFLQYGVPFTAPKPHVVLPSSAAFKQQVTDFAATCRVVKGMKRMTVGAIGARTTAFKTVRFDELALQHAGITTEALDLSEVIDRVKRKGDRDTKVKARARSMKQYTNWGKAPENAFKNLVKLSVVLDEIRSEYALDALSLRCWLEIEKQLNVSPCVVLSELNNRGVPAACELDVCNAVAMRALNLASESPATCLDWNNNYGEEEDKCILFHCGPVPQSMMKAKGEIVDHPMFAKVLGPGNGFGCNQGRIAANPMTFASTKTQDGKISFYLGEGQFTGDPIPREFFGCGGVAEIPGLQDKLHALSNNGYRHHVSVTTGHVGRAVHEAFTKYLKYNETSLD